MASENKGARDAGKFPSEKSCVCEHVWMSVHLQGEGRERNGEENRRKKRNKIKGTETQTERAS